jgi:hypothetical protein
MSHLSTAQISASLDGALTGPDSESLLAHLSSCVVCKEQRDRMATHDDALRRLFAFEPDHRALDASARAAVERFARFRPPEDLSPPTIQQDSTATPADPAQPLPPAREPSRGMRTPGTEPEAQASLEIAPRLDTERAPGATPDPASLLQTYDAFNDSAYAGPATRESPPMLGRPPIKKDEEDTPPGRKAYRHGGVQRDTPPTTPRDREGPPRRPERSGPAPRQAGFGVQREQQPAWSRLGLEPDPSSPGTYRETLTGATVSPPPVNTHRGGSGRSSSGRTALIASLVLVGGLAVVALAMRVPTGGHLDFRFGHDGNGAPAARPGTIDVKSATTPVPVDVAVPPATGGAATTFEELRLCGQVVDAKGRPVPDALLTVAATTTQARTGADGRFCLQAPAGTQIVEVLDPRGSGTTAHQVQMSFVSGAPEAHVVLP